MNSKVLIDAIVRQTTVLVAQLSTAAGIRAPLAHVADQVFVELARELEGQGLGKKVVADMFGLALRSYQKKVQRLTASETQRDRSLWEAVLGYLDDQGSCSRRKLLDRFRYDEEASVGAVLNDLVNSGLVYCTGRGAYARYGVTSDRDRERLESEESLGALASLVWLDIYRGCDSIQGLCQRLNANETNVETAVQTLLAEGRIERGKQGRLQTTRVLIPVGAKQGWEAAVFDHFRAVATAISSKVGRPRSRQSDVVGGQTAAFDLHPNHPHRTEVLALLANTRHQVTELWQRVSEHNQKHPVCDDEKTKVYFYFGQYVEDHAGGEELLQNNSTSNMSEPVEALSSSAQEDDSDANA